MPILPEMPEVPEVQMQSKISLQLAPKIQINSINSAAAEHGIWVKITMFSGTSLSVKTLVLSLDCSSFSNKLLAEKNHLCYVSLSLSMWLRQDSSSYAAESLVNPLYKNSWFHFSSHINDEQKVGYKETNQSTVTTSLSTLLCFTLHSPSKISPILS